MAKYMTPDFDVTVYEIEERIAAEVVPGDPDYDGGYIYGDLEVED